MSGSEWYVVKDDAAQRDFSCICPALGMDRCEDGGICHEGLTTGWFRCPFIPEVLRKFE